MITTDVQVFTDYTDTDDFVGNPKQKKNYFFASGFDFSSYACTDVEDLSEWWPIIE